MLYNFYKKNICENNILLHLIFLNIINLSFILIFTLISPFDFECDAATALRYSKFFIQHLFNDDFIGSPSHRPFFYPIYVLLSGTFIFDSLIPIIFFNSLLSIIEVNIIFLTFRYIGKNLSFILTTLLMFGGFFYIHINSFFETHLVLFFVVLSICGLVNFEQTKEKFFFYLCFFSLFCCFFTRFDTFFLLFLGLISLLLLVIKDKDFVKKEKSFYTIFLFSVSFLIILFWVFYKSFFLYKVGTAADRGNKDLFIESFFSLSVNHFTGQQLFWRMNNIDKSRLNYYYAKTNDKQKVKNVLNANLGEKSLLLFNTLNQIIMSDRSIELINNYKGRMKPLGLEKIYGTDVWERHYGEIFNNPRKIINQVFDPNFESLHYPDQIPSILKANIGTKKTDELLVDVYYEFKNKYPFLNLAILNDILNAYNIGFDYINHETYFLKYSPIGTLWYDIDFNLGNCAKDLFSERMYDQYQIFNLKSSKSISQNKKSLENISFLRIETLKVYFEKFRYYLKLFLGIISLLMIFSFFLFKECVSVFFINFSYLLSNSLVSYFVSTNGKMTVYFLPLLLFNLFFIFNNLKKKKY